MFFNLAWRNAKRSRSENVIYFLTLVTAVTAFYIMLSLGNQDVIRFLKDIESDAVNRLLTTMMPAIYLCALLFLFFLIIFADRYKLECRSRELGLYLFLGMKKKRLFFQLITEGLITSLLALLGGIICGCFLSEIISLVTSRLVGQGVITHQPSFSLSASIWTIVGFMLIQSIALMILSGRLFRQEIHQLLYGEINKKQDAGKANGGLITLVFGVVSLSGAYWIVLKHFYAAGGSLLIVAVILGITGTLLFIRGLARLMSLIARSVKSKAAHGLYTFTLRQLQENIVHKFIFIGVASILIMLAIVLIADGSTNIISHNSQSIRTASVYDFTVKGEDNTVKQYLSSSIMKPYVSDLNRFEAGKMKRPAGEDMGSFLNLSKLREQVVQKLPPDVKDPATLGAMGYEIGGNIPALNLLAAIESIKSPKMIPVSSYNRLLEAAGEKQLSLEENEAALYLSPEGYGSVLADMSTMMDCILEENENRVLAYLQNQPLYLLSSVPMKGLTADRNSEISTAIIVSDVVFDKYVNPDTHMVYWNFCIPKKLIDEKGLLRSIMDANRLLKPSGLVYESYLNNFGRQLFYVVSGSYTTLYLGFMFLIIACALLALQFLMQMQSTKKRYLILSMLGVRRKQIKKSIHRQVLWFFLLPLLLACVSGAVGLYAMQKYLHSATIISGQTYVLMIVMAGAVILMLSVYAMAVARTASREIGKLSWKPDY